MAGKVNRLSPFNITALALGMAFLYLPIVILVHLFLQRFAAGDGVGRLVAALVPRILQRSRDARCGMDEPVASPRYRRRSQRLLGTLAAVGLVRGERFGAGRCFPACSMRRW